MSSEKGLWKKMREKVAPFALVRRIEHRFEDGWPDVHYQARLPVLDHRSVSVVRAGSGFLELKEDEWPKRPDTPLFLHHLTKEQVLWHEEQTRWGGRADVLAKVGDDYLWLPVEVTRRVFQREMTRGDLGAYVLGSGKFPTAGVVKRMIG